MDAGDASALVVLPAGLQDAVLGQGTVEIRLVTNPAQRILPGMIEEALEDRGRARLLRRAPPRRARTAHPGRPPAGGDFFSNDTVAELKHRHQHAPARARGRAVAAGAHHRGRRPAPLETRRPLPVTWSGPSQPTVRRPSHHLFLTARSGCSARWSAAPRASTASSSCPRGRRTRTSARGSGPGAPTPSTGSSRSRNRSP